VTPADLSIPTGVTRRREPVGRTRRWVIPYGAGPYDLPVGHVVALDLTDDAASRQFGMPHRSAGELVWGSGWGSHVTEVLADDAAGRGWWVDHGDRRAVLVRPEDLLGAHDTGPLEDGETSHFERTTTPGHFTPRAGREEGV
jgi:hypothetical protein